MNDTSRPHSEQHPPWGCSLLNEYRDTLRQWAEADQRDRPGLSPDDREEIGHEKSALYDRRALIRSEGVSQFLTLLRWAADDNPLTLATILESIVLAIADKELIPIAHAVAKLEQRRARP